jgi:TonB family protein
MNLYRLGFVVVGLLLLTPDVHLTQGLTASKAVEMEYPALPMAVRISGTVKIKCILTADGKVVSAEILEAIADNEDPALKEVRDKSVRDLLGKAAQENAMRWTFIVPDKAESPSTVLTYRFVFETVKDPPNRTRSRFVFDPPANIRVIAELGAIQF